MANSRAPGTRAGLTRAQVVAGARELLSEEGAEGLTMRALARRLGVAPNALYSHVERKTALIDDVLDDVLAEVEVSRSDGRGPVSGQRGGTDGAEASGAAEAEPVGRLQAMMRSTLDVLLAHPELVPLYVSRQGARGPNAHRLGDVMLELLAAAGVTGGEAQEAQRVLIVYTIGFAALGNRLPPEADRPVPQAELVANFDRGLGWLLAGIAGAPTAPAAPNVPAARE